MPWEETENYIRSGHRNVNTFDSSTFKTVDIDIERGIKAIVAKPKDGNNFQIVSYLFDKRKGWTIENAKKWFEKYAKLFDDNPPCGSESFKWADSIFKLCKDIAETSGARVWKVKALHVGTTKNRTKFTEEELRAAARSLAWRPVNINHPSINNHPKARYLPFPENAVISAEYENGAVEAIVWISDPDVNRMIETGEINKASIEWVARDAKQVNGIEPKGVVFTGLALLTKDLEPGDPLASIIVDEKIEQNHLLESILRCPARYVLHPYMKRNSTIEWVRRKC